MTADGNTRDLLFVYTRRAARDYPNEQDAVLDLIFASQRLTSETLDSVVDRTFAGAGDFVGVLVTVADAASWHAHLLSRKGIAPTSGFIVKDGQISRDDLTLSGHISQTSQSAAGVGAFEATFDAPNLLNER